MTKNKKHPFNEWEDVIRNIKFDKKGTSEHDFLKQIHDAKITDEDKAQLCCVLAEGVPFQLNKDMASYLMALIHLEWRGFKPLRDGLIEELKKR